MSSFYNPLQRFYKFVLKRLLGQFLSSELDLEQLDVALSSGDVTLHRLKLNSAQLNEWADGLPVRVQSARIASLHCRVPWRSLLSQHCTLHVRGLHITLSPIAAQSADDDRHGGHSLHDSVYGAISDGLQRLNSRQLRQQVRLHRQLHSAIHSQQAHGSSGGGRRGADAAEEERRLAEEEAERDREERRRRRRRRRLQRLANRRAAQGRVRTQEGGNVEPDTDTDADTNDERTDEDDEDEADDEERQQHSQYGRTAGGDEGKEEDADEDIAAAGLRVVASFIERVVSMTEVTMDDITIALDCPLSSGNDEQPQPRTVRLELHIPSLEYCDMSRAATLSSSSSSSPSSAGSASLPPLSAGPLFSYSKLIRLHGFHLTLRTPDGEQLTIAHADVGQQCDVKVKVRMLDGGTVADTDIDVSSVRALLAPRQLSALHSLSEVLGSSSRLAARHVSAKRDVERLRAAQKERTSGSRGRKVNDSSSMSESEWSESGARSAQQQQRLHTQQQQQQPASTASAAPSASCAVPSAASLSVSSPLWSVSLNLHHALVAVLEDDDSIRAEWWLEPVTLPHSSPSPSMVLSPLISGVSVDHLLLSLREARIQASLTARLLSSSLTVSDLLVEEYLQQYRLLQSTLPSLSTDGALVYDRKQQRLGFSVRRLMSFERPSSGAQQQPHMRAIIESAVDGLLPPTEEELHCAVTAPVPVSSRICVDMLPVHIDLDLGLLSRLTTLCSTLSPTPVLTEQSFPSALSSSLSSSLSLAPSDGTALLLERTLSDMSNVSSPSSSILVPARSAAASSSSSVRLSVSSVDVSVLFPADTASQAAVATPLLRDGPADCFDSRGVLRGERLVLHIDRVACQSNSEAAAAVAAEQHGQQQQRLHEVEDSVWTVSFHHAAVDLLYPKEERQILHPRITAASEQSTATSTSRLNPLNFHSKRILSTSYITASDPPMLSTRPHTVTLINRAPLPAATSHGAGGSAATHSADSTRQLEALFLNGLPTYRWFEPSEGTTRDKPTAAATPSSSPAPSVGRPAAAAASSYSAMPSLAVASSPSSTSDAYLFEQVSASHSSLVLDVSLTSCTVHLSKVELDLLLLMYTIYDEITMPSPPAEAAATAVPLSQPLSSQTQSSLLSTESQSAYRGNTSAVQATAAVSLISPSAPFPQSDSASDSDSDGSEMFESVVGAESVFFQQQQQQHSQAVNGPLSSPALHSAEAGLVDDGTHSDHDDEDVAALSDIDSSDLDGETDDEQVRAAALYNSQFGMQSMLMGRSQQLSHGDRRVTQAAAPGNSDGRIPATSLYSTLLAGPVPAAISPARTVSDSLLFHSFVDQPASLSLSTVLPPASSFVPVTEQPYKFIKPLVPTTASAQPASPSQPPAFSSHRHRLSLRLSVREGGLCLQEEPVPLSLFSPLSASPVPPSSQCPPQSFHLDVQHLHLFQCSKLDGKDVSYVSVRAADCTLREYLQPVEADELLSRPSTPLLFKTLSDRSSQRDSSGPSTSSANGVLWHDPVFVGQFIIAMSPSLHLRETTAVLNLRALTLAYRPQSDWLGKLTDFVTLTAPPYVQTVGKPVQLNQHYTGFAPQPEQQQTQQQTGKPQPPPMTQDLVKLAFHVYDACFDYNPADMAARAALLVDHFHLHTIVHPLNKHSDIAIELRDAAVYLMPHSAKAQQSVVASSVRVVAPPQLHRLPADSLVSYLEELGCARVGVLDYLDARILQQDGQHVDPSRPLLSVELTNGELEVLTCADSFVTLLELASHIAQALVKQREIREVEVTHFTSSSSQQPRMDSKHDDDSSHDEQLEERREEEKDERLQQDEYGRAQRRTDLLQTVDPHLFGPDLGQAHREPTSQPSIVDTYCDEMKQATSISLALQAAAERELEKARRERRLNESIMLLQLQEEQRSRQREGGEGRSTNASSSSSGGAGQSSLARWQASDEDDGVGEQRAHWFSRSEMDEREVRDAMEQHSRTMPERSEQQQQLYDETEADDAQLRRRRRDEEIEEQLEMDRERRRRRQMDSGKQVSRKHQPMQPHVIDGHVTEPAEGHGSRAPMDGREEGAAQVAVRRFRLGEKTSGLVAESELLLHNVSVRWKVFDGSDWLGNEQSGRTQRHNQEASRNSRAEEADGVGEIEYGSEQHEQGESKYDHRVETERSVPANDSLSQRQFGFSLSDHVVHGSATVHENYVPSPNDALPKLQPSAAATLPTVITAATTMYPSQLKAAVAAVHSEPLVTPSIGRGVRRTDRMLELSLRGLHLLHQSFSATLSNSSNPSSSLSLAVQHVEVVDGVATSPYRLLLSSTSHAGHSNATRSSSASSCAVRLDALSVRPSELSDREELRVEAALHPLRVSIDQEAVELLIAFFSSNPLVLHTVSTAPATESHVTDSSFCQLFALTQPIELIIDYHPRRVSYSALRQGDYAQLLHLFPLQKMALTLPATTLTGLSLSAVGSHLANQWADDIARNQLHHYLSAIQPLRSIVNVGSGMVECVLLPYSQYRKQGRVLRAVKRGVSSLAKHAAVEGLGLLLTLTSSANALLREVDAIVAPSGPTHTQHSSSGPLAQSTSSSLSLTARTPDSLRAGLSVAYARLSASVHEAAHSLVVVPRDEWIRGGGRLGVLSVVRNLPAAALQPMIGVTDALHATIMAAQNTVDSTLASERNEMLKRPAE